MKKVIILVLLFIGVQSIYAQGVGLGVSVGYLSEIETVGFSADFIYEIDSKWGVSTDVTFAFSEESSIRSTWFAIDINGRYKLYEEFYVLAGGEYLNISFKALGLAGGSIGQEFTSSQNEFGVNLGGGYQYNILDNVNAFAEVKYVLLDAGYVHARLGILFDL